MRDLLIKEICELFQSHNTSRLDGTIALWTMAIAEAIEDGMTKDNALSMMGEMWDALESAHRKTMKRFDA